MINSFIFTSGAGKKKGGGSQNTISSGHREQLNKLMNTLDATSPHFVRCIIPNEIKTGGILDAHLVMHQLHCNGVLEGIRICRKGYPSRLIYSEFLQRYGILAAQRVKAKGADLKGACFEVLDEIKMDTENYRIGLSKVLFKAGILGSLEELRDTVIEKLLRSLQSQMRRFMVRKNIGAMLEQKKALTLIQKNTRAYLELKNWEWFKFYGSIKPLFSNKKKEEEERLRREEEERLAAEAAKAAAEAAKHAAEIEAKRKAEEEAARAAAEAARLAAELAERERKEAEHKAHLDKLSAAKSELEANVRSLEDNLASETDRANQLDARGKKLAEDVAALRQDVAGLENKVSRLSSDNANKDTNIANLKAEIEQGLEQNARLGAEKRALMDTNAQTDSQLAEVQSALRSVEDAKRKVEEALRGAEDQCASERREKNHLEAQRRKLETESAMSKLFINQQKFLFLLIRN